MSGGIEDYTLEARVVMDMKLRIQQLEAELKSKDKLLKEVSDTLEDLESYGFTCETGLLKNCIPFTEIISGIKKVLK